MKPAKLNRFKWPEIKIIDARVYRMDSRKIIINGRKPFTIHEFAEKYEMLYQTVSRMSRKAKSKEDFAEKLKMIVLKYSLGIKNTERLFIRGNRWETFRTLKSQTGMSQPGCRCRLQKWVYGEITDDDLFGPIKNTRKKESIRKKEYMDKADNGGNPDCLALSNDERPENMKKLDAKYNPTEYDRKYAGVLLNGCGVAPELRMFR